MTNCVNESKKCKLQDCLKEKEWICTIFAQPNYGSFAAHVESCGPETREGRGIFNSKLTFLLRTASLTSSPSKLAMLGEWSLHPFPGLLRARDAFTTNTFALLNCLHFSNLSPPPSAPECPG